MKLKDRFDLTQKVTGIIIIGLTIIMIIYIITK